MNKILNSKEIDCCIKSIVERMETFGLENSVLISILKGGAWTTHKIIEKLPERLKDGILIGYLGLSSYKDNVVSSGKVKVTYPLDLPFYQLEKKNIYIIDDIFDSGLTLTTAKSIIELSVVEKGVDLPTIRTVVLVNKMKPKVKLHRNTKDFPTISGFEYSGSNFLVGCGLGLGEQYRGFNSLYECNE